MFQQLRNIDTAFKHIRLFSLVLIAGCVFAVCFTLYKSFQLINESQERIYILSNGKALEAWSAERKDNIPVEARDHVRSFHHHFFTLDPMTKSFRRTLPKHCIWPMLPQRSSTIT